MLGKRGRITIPFEIRKALGFSYNDIVSFVADGGTVLVRREKLCDNCRTEHAEKEKASEEITLLDFLDGLTPDEQRAALIHLSVKWANNNDREALKNHVR